MKYTNTLSIAFIIAFFFISFSCKKKKDDDPQPTEKKKYAWVSGAHDSTGYGIILFTPDAGETWERQGLGSSALQGIDVSDIWAVDENNVWACGTGNSILNTTDGGQSWTKIQPSNQNNPNLSMISIVDLTDIWICGDSGTIYRSKDKGNTWSMIESNIINQAFLQGIWAIDTETVYTVGMQSTNSRGFIACTHDGGNTWDTISPAENYNKWEWIGAVAYGETIVIYGTKAHYMVSMDAGSTWKNDSVPDAGGGGGEADINDLIMLDEDTWWGAFDMGNIFITRDGGTTWTQQGVPDVAGGSFLVGIDCWDEDLALVVASGFYYPPVSPILKTENGGSSPWTKQYMADAPLWKVSFIKD